MNRLREIREAAGVRREQLALDLGVSTATIERWESPVGRQIPGKHMLALAREFGVSIDHLLGFDAEREDVVA